MRTQAFLASRYIKVKRLKTPGKRPETLKGRKAHYFFFFNFYKLFMRIVITGVAGSGKTTAAKKISAKLNIPIFDLKQYIKERKLYDCRDKDGTMVVDSKKLEKKIRKDLPERYVLEGLLACEISVPADFVFVMRTEPKKLEKRLRKRKYSEKKIMDNLESEAIDYCSVKARENYPEKKVFDVDSAEEILRVIKGESRGKSFDFLDYFSS